MQLSGDGRLDKISDSSQVFKFDVLHDLVMKGFILSIL